MARGGRCTSAVYINTDTKLNWACSEGHEWAAKLNHIKDSGSWCPKCAKLGTDRRNAARLFAKAQQHATAHNGQCLSAECKGAMTRLRWQCAIGHQWIAAYRHVISNNSWCPYCSGLHNNSIELARELAESRGGTCESQSYENIRTPMFWRCANGHDWTANLSNIKHNNEWCPVCSGRYDHLPKMHLLAASKGGKCLATEPPMRAKDHVGWECAKGHQWTASTDNVLNGGKWCPNCRYRSEDEVRQLFEALTGAYFPKTRNILESKRLELDGYCKSLQIAFEYQGVQHYKYVPHFHRNGPSDLDRQKERDQLKLEQCETIDIVIIVVPYYLKDVEQFVRGELSDLGVLADDPSQA